MKRSGTKIGFIFSLMTLVVVMQGCFKGEVYPNEPIISDPVFVNYGDSAVLSFSFTDGDGDLGLYDSEIQSPYDTSSRYHYNLYIDYWEKDDVSGWGPGYDLNGDTIQFKYRLEPIIVKGKKKGIKGTMDVTMKEFFNPLSDQSDTIKYGIILIDKSLNESNQLWTEEISI